MIDRYLSKYLSLAPAGGTYAVLYLKGPVRKSKISHSWSWRWLADASTVGCVNSVDRRAVRVDLRDLFLFLVCLSRAYRLASSWLASVKGVRLCRLRILVVVTMFKGHLIVGSQRRQYNGHAMPSRIRAQGFRIAGFSRTSLRHYAWCTRRKTWYRHPQLKEPMS